MGSGTLTHACIASTLLSEPSPVTHPLVYECDPVPAPHHPLVWASLKGSLPSHRCLLGLAMLTSPLSRRETSGPGQSASQACGWACDSRQCSLALVPSWRPCFGSRRTLWDVVVEAGLWEQTLMCPDSLHSHLPRTEMSLPCATGIQAATPSPP